MNHPAWKAIQYFWHAARFDERKMRKILWMYFDDYKENIILSNLEPSKLTLKQYIRKNKTQDFHDAIQGGQGELLGMLNPQEKVTRDRILFMTLANFPDETIKMAADGFSQQTVDLFLKYFGNIELIDFSDFSSFLITIKNPLFATCWHEALIEKKQDKISKILWVPKKLSEIDSLSHDLMQSLLKKAAKAIDTGNFRFARKHIESYRVLKSVDSGFKPDQESLAELLKREIEDEPTILTLQDLNQMAGQHPAT